MCYACLFRFSLKNPPEIQIETSSANYPLKKPPPPLLLKKVNRPGDLSILNFFFLVLFPIHPNFSCHHVSGDGLHRAAAQWALHPVAVQAVRRHLPFVVHGSEEQLWNKRKTEPQLSDALSPRIQTHHVSRLFVPGVVLADDEPAGGG